MLIEKAGCVTFNYATKIGDWWCDIIETEPHVDYCGNVLGFETYEFADKAVKSGEIALYVDNWPKNGKPGYVGLYLAKERALPEGYTEVVE